MHGNKGKVGLVQTIRPAGCKQRKVGKIQTQGKSLLLRDGTWDNEGGPASTCSTGRAAVLGTPGQRTTGSGNTHQDIYCMEVADGARRVPVRDRNGKEAAVHN